MIKGKRCWYIICKSIFNNYSQRDSNMISEYKMQVIQQIKQELVHDWDTGEFILSGKYFKELEPDSTLTFSNYHEALNFIIDTTLMDLA